MVRQFAYPLDDHGMILGRRGPVIASCVWGLASGCRRKPFPKIYGKACRARSALPGWFRADVSG
jgi:hypothetical protein